MNSTGQVPAQTADDWLAQRKQGIGGSDAPIVCGESTWSSPAALWAIKTGKIGGDELIADSARDRLEFGHDMEEVIVKRLTRRTGRKAELAQQFKIERHKEIPWLICTLDARFTDDPGHIVQCKNVSEYAGWKWDDGVPPEYMIQVHHEMAVVGAHTATIAAQIGATFKQYVIPFDAEYWDAIFTIERDFWENHVLADVSPPLDGHSTTGIMLKKLHPDDNGKSIELSAEIETAIKEYQVIGEEIKKAEKEHDSLKNKIVGAIGSNTFGVTPGGIAVSYKTIETAAYTVAGKKYRKLHVKK